jgi:dihydroneopterin aldolase
MSTDIPTRFMAATGVTATRPQRDCIFVRDYVRDVEIGAFQQERGTVQRVRFNVTVEVAGADEPIDDDVDQILSYDTITQAISHALSEERLNLLETLAERIAALLIPEPRARRVFVRIEKLDRGPFALGVEIVRDAQSVAPAEVVAPPSPVVVHLSNAAVHDPRLPRWLDQINGLNAPVVLTLGFPDLARPDGGNRHTARRIDLLAIEQNAWVLAGKDDRCVVVNTRTEIDWALGQGHTMVWAPMKLVMDAVDKPENADGVDPAELTVWVADLLGARATYWLGRDVELEDTLVL